ncbi:hypothetical protein J1614_007707 [Plenodomus biglobosus]|nr:hypothetical protein J1614_007707 [Plenodomus biglobosus]
MHASVDVLRDRAHGSKYRLLEASLLGNSIRQVQEGVILPSRGLAETAQGADEGCDLRPSLHGAKSMEFDTTRNSSQSFGNGVNRSLQYRGCTNIKHEVALNPMNV